MKKIMTKGLLCPSLFKISLKMKLTTLLLVISLFEIHASSYSQNTKVSLNLKDATIEQVFREIESKTEFKFLYKNKEIELNRKVSINVKNKNINEILGQLFKDTKIGFKVYENRQIILSLQPVPQEAIKKNIDEEVQIKEKQISGKVTDKSGMPIAGANIKVLRTKKGVNTDSDGNFTLLAENGDVLEFSYLGMKTKRFTLQEETQIKIVMEEEASNLNDVVVVGYGTQKKSSMTGSVTSIKPEQMQKQIGSTIGSTLQGLAPGVEIIQPGGIAGSDVSILIRGAASFGSTDPLYVIDGAFSNSGLSVLNPEDIASIEILKDGAAAAIYGSRAANGVVIITTKSGKKGLPKFTLTSNFTLQSPTKYNDYLSADEWRTFINQVDDNSGTPRDDRNKMPSTSQINTDWQREWLKPASLYKVNMELGGGSENITYNTSLGYLDQKGMTAFSGFKRYDSRINTTFKRNRLTVTENLSISRQEKTPTPIINVSRPTLPVYDSLGRLTSGSSDNGVVLNPLAAPFYSERKVNNTYLVGSLGLGYKISEPLEYKFKAGGSYNSFENMTHTPVYNTLWDENGVGVSQYGNNINSLDETRGVQFNYNIDNTLYFRKKIKQSNLDFLLGQSIASESTRRISIATISDLGAPNITGTGIVNGRISANTEESLLLSYFFRLNYDFDGKYLFGSSLRNDISSKFSKDYRSGLFPSISAGWNVHKEKWFENKLVSQLKIRASYGSLGANFISPYQFNTTLIQMPSPLYSTSSTPSMANAAQIYPINLTWETSVSKNIGADFGLFNNDLNFTIEYFEKNNKGLLASVPAGPSSGQGLTQPTGGSARLVPVNSANVKNHGLEFSANYKKNIGDFKLNFSGNIASVRNKVITLGDNVAPILGPIMSGTIGDNMTITQKGYPIGSFYGFVADGLTDQGKIRIKTFDDNGNVVYKSIENGLPKDKTIIGSPIPDFTYGLNLGLSYKKFDLTIFFQGVKGGDIFNRAKYDNFFDYSGNLLKEVLNSWTPTNTNTNIPLASRSLVAQSGRPSTFFIEDGSYLRLKNLQLGYNAVSSEKMTMRVFVGVQNLFTITKYTGLDPEVSGSTTFMRNVDLNQYPNARILNFGFSSSF